MEYFTIDVIICEFVCPIIYRYIKLNAFFLVKYNVLH